MIRRHPQSKRPGLTLMELIVVLVILVGLAGIVVPMISNIQSQTRYSTAGANLQEIATMVSSYKQTNSKYPDGWDTLTVGTGLATYLPGMSTGTLSTYVTTTTTAAGDNTTTSLQLAGITSVYPFVATPANPTFFPYGTAESTAVTGSPGATIAVIPTPTLLSTGGVTLAVLTPAGATKLNLPTTITFTGGTVVTPTYVVLGLGSRNTIIPKMILDAPVHTADNANTGPNLLYGRFGVVFQVATDASLNPQPATMVCVVDFSNEQGIVTLGNEIENYNNSVQLGQ